MISMSVSWSYCHGPPLQPCPSRWYRWGGRRGGGGTKAGGGRRKRCLIHIPLSWSGSIGHPRWLTGYPTVITVAHPGSLISSPECEEWGLQLSILSVTPQLWLIRVDLAVLVHCFRFSLYGWKHGSLLPLVASPLYSSTQKHHLYVLFNKCNDCCNIAIRLNYR